jgi:hypothetical protein
MSQPAKHAEIFNWTAKRSGAHMTVTGKGSDGCDILLTRVTRIQNGLVFNEGSPIYRLVNGAA